MLSAQRSSSTDRRSNHNHHEEEEEEEMRPSTPNLLSLGQSSSSGVGTNGTEQSAARGKDHASSSECPLQTQETIANILASLERNGSQSGGNTATNDSGVSMTVASASPDTAADLADCPSNGAGYEMAPIVSADSSKQTQEDSDEKKTDFGSIDIAIRSSRVKTNNDDEAALSTPLILEQPNTKTNAKTQSKENGKETDVAPSGVSYEPIQLIDASLRNKNAKSNADDHLRPMPFGLDILSATNSALVTNVKKQLGGGSVSKRALENEELALAKALFANEIVFRNSHCSDALPPSCERFVTANSRWLHRLLDRPEIGGGLTRRELLILSQWRSVIFDETKDANVNNEAVRALPPAQKNCDAIVTPLLANSTTTTANKENSLLQSFHSHSHASTYAQLSSFLSSKNGALTLGQAAETIVKLRQNHFKEAQKAAAAVVSWEASKDKMNAQGLLHNQSTSTFFAKSTSAAVSAPSAGIAESFPPTPLASEGERNGEADSLVFDESDAEPEGRIAVSNKNNNNAPPSIPLREVEKSGSHHYEQKRPESSKLIGRNTDAMSLGAADSHNEGPREYHPFIGPPVRVTEVIYPLLRVEVAASLQAVVKKTDEERHTAQLESGTFTPSEAPRDAMHPLPTTIASRGPSFSSLVNHTNTGPVEWDPFFGPPVRRKYTANTGNVNNIENVTATATAAHKKKDEQVCPLSCRFTITPSVSLSESKNKEGWLRDCVQHLAQR